MNTPTAPESTSNPFDVLLHDLSRGKVMRQLNEALPELVKAVRSHGKAGTLNLTLKVAPASGGDASRATITAAVTVKSPVAAPRAGIYFTTEEGAVQKNDPDQNEFPFKALAGGAPVETPAPIAIAQPATT